MTYRIACVGTGGTGKTTVARLLAEKLDLPLRGSVAREVQREQGITEADQFNLDPERLFDLQDEIFYRQADNLLRPGFHISDRSLIDSYAYSLERSPDYMTEELCADYASKCISHFMGLDLLVYFPVGVFEPPGDGFRSVSFGRRKAHDTLIQGLFLDLAIPPDSPRFVQVPDSGPEHRVKFILWALQNLR